MSCVKGKGLYGHLVATLHDYRYLKWWEPLKGMPGVRKYYKLNEISFILSERMGFAEIPWISFAGNMFFRLVFVINTILFWYPRMLIVATDTAFRLLHKCLWLWSLFNIFNIFLSTGNLNIFEVTQVGNKSRWFLVILF